MRTLAALLVAAALAAACASCTAGPRAYRAAGPGAVTIVAQWDGHAPAQVADAVAVPLEKELAAVKGVSRMLTRCDDKGCTILLQFSPDVSPDEIAFEASAAVKRAKLPRGAAAVAYAADVHRPPDLVLALILDAKTVTADHYTAALDFASGLMQLPGTVRYEVPGAPKEETFVEVVPERAKALGVDESEIAKLIDAQVITLDDQRRIILGERPESKGDVGSVVVKQTAARPVRLRDIARIAKSLTPGAVCRLNGEPAVLVHVFLRSGATPAEVRACFDRVLKQRRPAAIQRIIPAQMRTE